MSFQELFYPENKLGGFTGIDGTIAFYFRINSLLSPSFNVLDVGCGRGGSYHEDLVLIRRNLRNLKGKVKKVIGIDVDKAAKKNPYLNEFHLIENENWPIKTNTINLIVCDYVLEHVNDIDKFFSEARRVLRSGGYLCIRTPNVWSYFGIFSRLIPSKYHSQITNVVQNDRKEEDVFPTLYRCNSIWGMKVMMKKHGFDPVVYGYEAEPAYLSFSKFAYWLGVLHQKYAPNFLKVVIFAFGKKL